MSLFYWLMQPFIWVCWFLMRPPYIICGDLIFILNILLWNIGTVGWWWWERKGSVLKEGIMRNCEYNRKYISIDGSLEEELGDC